MGSSSPRVARNPVERDERNVAIIDLGSNTFRLVVFRYTPGGPFALTDEIREAVRLGAGIVEGAIQPDARDRAATTVGTYAAFCRRTGVDDVIAAATSAIRDATNQDEVLEAFFDQGVTARVLSPAEEAYYGYLGIVNSTTLSDGYFVDIGGGSAQIGRVTRRTLERSMSEPIGAVRMTERFFGSFRAKRSEIKALRKHITEVLQDIPWIGAGALPLVGIGGTIRNLAAMAQRAADYPLAKIHGYVLTRESVIALIDQVAAQPVSQRHRIPGVKADRADIILAGAVTLDTVMEAIGTDGVEVCGQGLREGLFYEHYLRHTQSALIGDVRRATVMNVAGLYRADIAHAEHVALLALELFDGTARAGCHGADPSERELLWAAAMLHDIGVIVDYHDHHKHGFYLVMNAGLPGFDHRELALIAMLVRAHRKAPPSLETWLTPILADGDEERFLRLATCLRLAEQLERDRARNVHGVAVEGRGRTLALRLTGPGDHSVAMWSATQDAELFQRAFGRRMQLVAGPDAGPS